jgi:hypothetical protein
LSSILIIDFAPLVKTWKQQVAKKKKKEKAMIVLLKHLEGN